MIPWLLARESRQPFFFPGVCEKAVSPMVSLMLFRTFFIAFSAARHVFPSEISYAKVAAGDSNLCMNLG